MRKALTILAGLACVVLALPIHADSYGNATIRYENGPPYGSCTNRHLWWDKSADAMWLCEDGHWIAAGGDVRLPISEVDGVMTAALNGFADAASSSATIAMVAANGSNSHGATFTANTDTSVPYAQVSSTDNVHDTTLTLFPDRATLDHPLSISAGSGPTSPAILLADFGGGASMYYGPNGGPALGQNQKQLLRCDNNANNLISICVLGDDTPASGGGSLLYAGSIGTTIGVALTEGSATVAAMMDVSLAAGGEFKYCVLSYVSSTSSQMRCGHFMFAAVNNGGTVSVTAVPAAPDNTNDGSAIAATSGTLTYTWTFDTATSGRLKFKLNATSSLSQVVLNVWPQVIGGPGQALLLP